MRSRAGRCRAAAGPRIVRRRAVQEQAAVGIGGQVPTGLAVLGYVGVGGDQAAHHAGRGAVGGTGDHHAAIAVPDENGVADVLGSEYASTSSMWVSRLTLAEFRWACSPTPVGVTVSARCPAVRSRSAKPEKYQPPRQPPGT